MYLGYDSYPNAPCTAAQLEAGCITQDLSGERMPYAPEHSANLNLQYSYPVSEIYELGFRTDVNYTDWVYLQLDNDPVDTQDAFTKVNARLSLYNRRHRWELALIGRNLTDNRTSANSIDLPVLANGAHVADLQRPRWLSAEISMRW